MWYPTNPIAMTFGTARACLCLLVLSAFSEAGAQRTVASVVPDTFTVPAAARTLDTSLRMTLRPTVSSWVTEQALAAFRARWDAATTDLTVRKAIPVRFRGQVVGTQAADALSMLVIIEQVRVSNQALLALKAARTGETEQQEQDRLREQERLQAMITRYLTTLAEKLAQLRESLGILT